MTFNRKVPACMMAILPAALVFCCIGPLARAQGTSLGNSEQSEGIAPVRVPSGTALHINLAKRTHISKLKAGSEFDGELSRPIYVVDREAIPAGSKMHFIVDSVEKKPLPTRAFTDRISEVLSFGILKDRIIIPHFSSAELYMPDGKTIPVQLNAVRANDVVSIHANGNEVKLGMSNVAEAASAAPGVSQTQTMKKKEKEFRHPVLTATLSSPLMMEAPVPASANSVTAVWHPNQDATLKAGTRAQLLLLTQLDANKSKVGDPVEARLLEPIIERNQVLLPEGTRFYGHITHVKGATIGRRPASLLLSLDQVSVEGGHPVPVAGSLTSMETDPVYLLKMNSEGGLKPGHPGLKEIGRDIALAWVPGKAFNDSYDSTLPITANVGGLAIWTGMFFIHKGHDVIVPTDTELEMTFSRDTTIPGASVAQR